MIMNPCGKHMPQMGNIMDNSPPYELRLVAESPGIVRLQLCYLIFIDSSDHIS
jgi:hypothetical protein